ncbi:hypothetical protein BAX97_04440 [Elizabethkingia meningoseptica]|uniref:hypothetical protein n=1 Tax=Elizabethkingia meningoseptica TaxID=238 RepID=UPI0003807228|nr:hypothetical protein [Elizabethkingia meningoseptica]AQX06842.1 hypothetical protein BBD33_16930 [Elizabethkingia meningoseptica]AQX48888.1 hypothetical protein B5G46_16915 [Elizabethkingia meningoseptica]KUY14974.1 hypothetical protein ATB99_10740 [Elizabethkingia meningoseptica]OPB69655.1 hypothetical protein BAY30_05870 [Elizabethkingia meningoseptica]OPC33554.1 hypothetical protein BAX97_04440 [Elizabethkingia meningoseptica]
MDLNFIKAFKVCNIETSSINATFLLNYEGKFYQISESLAILICILGEVKNIKEATVKYNKIKNYNYTEKNILFLINEYLIPIVEKNHPSGRIESFKFKKELFTASIIAPVTKNLSFFFNPIVFKILITTLVVLLSFFIFHNKPQGFKLNTESYFIISFCFFISVIIHELGHASACKYYNIEHGSIGFAIYLYFPVFYADVSNAWLLPRKKRVIIDFAGIYFQSIFLIPFIICFFAIGNPIAYYIIFSIFFSFILDLNPFFKFDGYWIISDALGIPNLREKTHEIPKYLYSKYIKKQNSKKPFLFELKKVEKFCFLLYFVLANLFFGYVFLYKIPYYLFVFLSTFPHEFKDIFYRFFNKNIPSFQETSLLLYKLFIGLLMLYFCYNLIKRIFK